jgi:hypothetical protein
MARSQQQIGERKQFAAHSYYNYTPIVVSRQATNLLGEGQILFINKQGICRFFAVRDGSREKRGGFADFDGRIKNRWGSNAVKDIPAFCGF